MEKLDHTNMAQVSALLEALLSTAHPFHESAREMAVEFNQRAMKERVEAGRRMMQQQIDDGFDLGPWTR